MYMCIRINSKTYIIDSIRLQKISKQKYRVWLKLIALESTLNEDVDLSHVSLSINWSCTLIITTPRGSSLQLCPENGPIHKKLFEETRDFLRLFLYHVLAGISFSVCYLLSFEIRNTWLDTGVTFPVCLYM